MPVFYVQRLADRTVRPPVLSPLSQRSSGASMVPLDSRRRVPGRFPWNLMQVHAPLAWGVTRGDPTVLVAVVDTGIDLDHPDLRGKVVSGVATLGASGVWRDDLGHGTSVASLIASRGWRDPGYCGVAPGCRLISIKCNVPQSRHVRAEHIAAGVQAAIDQGAQVINLSVGVVKGEALLTTEALEELAAAIRLALAKGIPVICAAGPAGPGPTPWPAAWANDAAFFGLIAVGGADDRRRVSAWNPTPGNFISVLAPADDVLCGEMGGDIAPFGGTSAAAPHVAGIVALIRSVRPFASPRQIRAWVCEGAAGGIASAAGSLALALR